MDNKCSNCKNSIKNGNGLTCPNCGAMLCSDCAKKTKAICPYCYSDLDYLV